MSEGEPQRYMLPSWTVGDRLRKARESVGLSQAELAADIGISRRSVSSYEASTKPPRKVALLGWSMRTNVPLEWLLEGQIPPAGPGSPWSPRLDSNQWPTD
jgi:transcriptional regulator with XRE-family HTH domain